MIPILSEEERRQLAELFMALSHPLRLHLIEALLEQPRTVSELVRLTGAGQTSVSQHLTMLMRYGLVEYRAVASYEHGAPRQRHLYRCLLRLVPLIKAAREACSVCVEA